jgi:hypothetical protein
MILFGLVLACSSEGSGSPKQTEAQSPLDGSGGAGALPEFCDYQSELRTVPEGACDFVGVCQVRVATYCENPDAANRKKYDCECIDGKYRCTVTESGLSIDDTCTD